MSGCSTCGGPLGKRNRSGRCRACAARETAIDPVSRAKATARLRAKFAADPAFAAAAVERARHASASRDMAQMSAIAMVTRPWEKAVGHRWQDTPPGDVARRRVGARISATKLAHIPSDYRRSYRAMIAKGVPANDAEAAIADQVEVDRRRMRAEMMGAA